MNHRRQTKIARNQPKQSRSRATVNVILEAMIRVLDQEGYEAATTTRVAEVAGVSIGTLYQYFSNRDAILDALQDRELTRAWEFMEAMLNDAHRFSERELARMVIRGLLELYAAAPALHRVLVIEGLRVTPPDRVHAFDLRMTSAIRSFLALGHLRVRRVNLDAAAFVIFQSVRATMMARLLEAPANLDDDTLVEELTDLLVRYLVDETERSAEQTSSGRTRAVRAIGR
jgi:AcrR family transcriptional regulator